MAKFEGQERRMPKIEACLAEYGWKTLEDADALCNSSRRHPVIPRNHNRLYARPDTFCNCCRRFLPRRVHHGNQSQECKILFIRCCQRLFPYERLCSKCQHPQTVL